MKAIVVHEYGERDVMELENVERPQPGPGEVLIRIKATGVNPVDAKVRQGYMEHKLPFIPGWDMAGIIEEVAADVSNFEPGDEVFGRPDVKDDGTYAEYMVAKAIHLAKRPTTISFEESAAVPLAGLTAWQGLFTKGNLQKGQKVFIHGATGGVGHYAVQLAKWKGAEVTGTASPENHQYLREIGADITVDYRQKDFEKEFSGYDMVFDLIGGETQERSLKMLKPGGILVTTVKLENEQLFKDKGMRATGMFAESKPEDLQQLAKLVDDKKLVPRIDRIMRLDQARTAHQLIEEGHVTGKIVLVP